MSDEAEAEGGEDKSARMMLIIGILVGLAVGSIGVFLWLNSKSDEPEPEIEEVVEEIVEEEAAINYIYLYIERMPAALVDENQRTVGYVFLDITLELHNSDEQSYVSSRMPRVKDSLLRAISEHGLTRPGTRGQLDYDRVSEYLLKAANDAIGKEYVMGVYITRALRAPS